MPRVTIAEAGHATAGPVQEIAVTRVSSRVVTALRNGSGRLQVIAWDVGADGAITRRGDALGGEASRVSVTDWPEGPGVVTAVRTASGDLKVIAWEVTSAGDVVRRGDASAGAVSETAISSPGGFAGVVTPVRTASGDLKVIAWHVSASGAVARAGSASGGACSAIAVSALSSAGGASRFATAFRNSTGHLEVSTWAVTGLGVVSRLHEAAAGPIRDVALTCRSTRNADLVTVSRGAGDDLTVIGWVVSDAGALDRLTTARGGAVEAVAVATWKPDVHTYVVAAMRTAGSNELKLIVWRNGQDLKRHGEIVDGAVEDVVLTTWSQGVVAVSRDGAGHLRLTSFRLRPAGIRLLHRVWPDPGAADATDTAASADQIRRVPRARKYGDPQESDQPSPTSVDDGVEAGSLSPEWQQRFFPNVSGVDPMLAVGHQFVVVTQDHRIAFLDRQGNALPSKNGEPTNLSATAFFLGFIQEKNQDDSPNEDNVNLLSPQQISEFYDTRCTYDAPSRRFAILSAARKPGTKDTRFVAFAVSKTEDPRDGFEQYMTTESNYRDFPRLAVHGDRLLVGHNAAGQAAEGETPVLYAFDYSSLRQGVADPPNWQFYPSDLNGAARVFLVHHHGGSGGVSFLIDIRKGDATLHVLAFPLSSADWLAPAPLFADVTLSSQAPWLGPFAVFRNQALHLAGHVRITDRVPNVAPPRMSVRTIKVPLAQAGTAGIAIDGAGVRDRTFGLNATTDAPGDKVTYDFPGLAVNQHGDTIFAFGRTGVETETPLFPEARYTIWIDGESAQRRSRLLQAGSYQPTWFFDASATDNVPAETVATSVTHAYQLDFATAVVDPVDDRTFWFIHEYADGATNTWKTVVGVVDPRP